MAPLKTYRELEVWQKGIEMVEAVYRLSKTFPNEERFGLTSQMQRAAVSVPANIAEGYGRMSRPDYLHHLAIARGSLMELETHLTIAVRLDFAQRDQALPVWDLSQQVGRLLHGLIQSLRRGNSTPKPRPPNPKP